jgi:hypothetical protein
VPVDAHVAFIDEALGMGPRSEWSGKELVEPRSRRVRRDLDPASRVGG